MNILFVASVYRHLTAFHIPYIRYLQGKGYKVYAAASSGQDMEELEAIGVFCINISFVRNPMSIKNWEALWELRDLFKNHQFQLIHVHTPVAAFLTRFAFRYSNKGKIVYTAHGFHFYKGAPILNWLIYYPIERLAARWTDCVITINEEDYKRARTMGFKKNRVRYVHGVGVEKIDYLYSKVNEVEKKAFKNELGLLENAIVISYIAEINKNKNHIFLLSNWNRIKEFSPLATLLLIGEGELKLEIENYIVKNKLVDVHVLGFRTDVNKLLNITDIVSLLSHREGLPKSIMEAMVKRIPCIVSNTRGLRDLILDGESGYVVDRKNDERLVSVFVSLLNNKDLREEMGKVAYRNIEPYLLENVLREYIDIYEDVLRNG